MIEAPEKLNSRLASIDFLRGLVMVIMLLDHVREYIHADATRFSPTDLTKTSVVLFLTRWVTHFCAPAFVFLAGTSIYLRVARGKSRREMSKYLVKRGAWLVLLEFTLVRFGIFFNVDYGFLGLAQVIWVIGVSMIVLAALVHLSMRIVGISGVLMILLHNLLDGIRVPPATAMAGTPPPGAWQKLWLTLHQPGFFPLFENNSIVFIAYPLVPWIGVMAAGYWLGVVYTWDAERRRRWLLRLGGALLILFTVIRATNPYGDPQVWQVQPRAAFTVLSFINVTKYPPSLLFLLLTLGVSLLILAWADGRRNDDRLSRMLITFGRVPLFYYLLQWIVAHGLAVVLTYLAGKSTGYLFLNFPASATEAPPDAGFPLWVVYAAWLGGVLLLYPLCRWYGRIKERRRTFPFNYI